MSAPLVIREEQKQMYVQGISEYCIRSVEDSMALLK